VRQVLLNFLDNATRYGPRGQRVRVGVERAGPTARVWVEDEGPGVPPAERTRVFAPYYRMARDAAVTGGGSGIGLAVVRDLAERYGGRAWVENGRLASAPEAGTLGAGARFVAEFQAAPAGAPRDADDEPAPLRSRTGEWRVVDGTAAGIEAAGIEAAGADVAGVARLAGTEREGAA
jgi:hypothetical protein